MSDINGSEGSTKDLSYFKGLLCALNDGELKEFELTEVLEVMTSRSDLQSQLQGYWLKLQATQSILAKDSDASIPNSLHNEQALSFSHKLSQKISKLSVESSVSNNVVGIGATQNRSTNHANDLSNSQASDSSLGFRNFAIAASVMVIVTFGWLGSQSEVRQELATWFEPNAIGIQGENENLELLALPSVSDRVIPQDSVLVSAAQVPVSVISTDGSSNSNGSAISDSNSSLYLSSSRVKDYIRLHAEHASLNTNQGIMPFARMTKISTENQF